MRAACARPCVRARARACVRPSVCPLVASLSAVGPRPESRPAAEVWLRARPCVCVRARARACVRASVCPLRLELRALRIPRPSSRPYPLGEAALIAGAGPENVAPPHSPASRNPCTRPSGLRGKWKGAIHSATSPPFWRNNLPSFLASPGLPSQGHPKTLSAREGMHPIPPRFCWTGFSPPIHIHKCKSQPRFLPLFKLLK